MEKIKLKLEIGLDVTELLGIVKYDPPLPPELQGVARGNFPTFIPKTDEERIQNLSVAYENWKTNPTLNWYESEKLNGTSTTYYLNDGEFGACSRNLDLELNEDIAIWKMARELKLEESLRSMGKNLAVQGELIGEGIQGNPYKLKDKQFRAFKIFDIDTQIYYGLPMFLATSEHALKIDTVPILNMGMQLPDTIDEILENANGKSVLNDKSNREGSVFNSLDGTLSFKVISNYFLLKDER